MINLLLSEDNLEILKNYVNNLYKETDENSNYIKNFCIFLSRELGIKKVQKRRYYKEDGIIIIYDTEAPEKDGYFYFIKLDFQSSKLFNQDNEVILYRIHEDDVDMITDTFKLKNKDKNIIGTRIPIFHSSLEKLQLKDVIKNNKSLNVKPSTSTPTKKVTTETKAPNLNNKQWVNEEYLTLSLDEGDDLLYTQLTARDKACIDLKVPMSSKKWLNDLIEFSLKN